MSKSPGFFTFDNVSSRDFGVYINGNRTFNSPQRVVTTQAVPGRNGELLIDEGRFSNIDHAYDAFLYQHFRANISGLRNYLSSKIGYHRLEDSYHPDEFYLAMFVAGLDVDATSDLHAGTFTITFNRKPQRYLKSGERVATYTSSSGNIFNPTDRVSLPLVRVYGTGTFGIGGCTIKINTNPGYIDLDCEIQDAYMGATNCNGKIELTSGDFPKLNPGNNGITRGNGISRIEITPRWWRI